jgi:hypothetical protein
MEVMGVMGELGKGERYANTNLHMIIIRLKQNNT